MSYKRSMQAVPMGRTSPTPVRIREEAVRLFGERGFANSTMREIMVACDLTPGAFYNHFRSKEELLYSIISEAHDSLDAALNEALSSIEGDSESVRLSLLSSTFAVWHCVNPHVARVANSQYRELTGEQRDTIVERRRALREQFEHVLTRGVKMGQFLGLSRTDVRLTAISLVEMLVAIADWFDPTRATSPDQIGAFYSGAALRLAGGIVD